MCYKINSIYLCLIIKAKAQIFIQRLCIFVTFLHKYDEFYLFLKKN